MKEKIAYLALRDPLLYKALEDFSNSIEKNKSDIKTLADRVSALELYPHCAAVKATSNQSINSGAGIPINFDTITFDNNHFWNSSLPSRFTAHEAGWYAVGGSLAFAKAANTLYIALIAKTDVAAASVNIVRSQVETIAIPANDIVLPPPVAILHLSPNEYVELFGFQNSGGALNSIAANEYPHFWIYRLPMNPNQEAFK